jgi:hypothetical protein
MSTEPESTSSIVKCFRELEAENAALKKRVETLEEASSPPHPIRKIVFWFWIALVSFVIFLRPLLWGERSAGRSAIAGGNKLEVGEGAEK